MENRETCESRWQYLKWKLLWHLSNIKWRQHLSNSLLLSQAACFWYILVGCRNNIYICNKKRYQEGQYSWPEEFSLIWISYWQLWLCPTCNFPVGNKSARREIRVYWIQSQAFSDVSQTQAIPRWHLPSGLSVFFLTYIRPGHFIFTKTDTLSGSFQLM